MNLKNYIIGAALSATILVGANLKEGEQIKVSVVHYANGETTVMDTTFDASSGYTVEAFLKENGLDPHKTRIINTDAFDGKQVLETGNSVLFMRDMGDFDIEIDEDIEGGEVRTVSVIKKTDENGEVTIEKVMGNDPGSMGSEVIVEELNGETEDVFMFKSSEDDQTVKIEKVNGEMTIEVNGEEMAWEELMDNDDLTDGQIQMIQKQMNSDENGEGENVFYQIESEESDGVRAIVVQKEIHRGDLSDEMEDELRQTIEVNVAGDMGFEHTIAIVSTVSGGGSSDERFISDRAELPIEGPSYFPNPTEGKFRLEFFLPERGQTQIQIFDSTGRLVLDENLGNFQGAYNDEIDISHLESGHYIMNITQNNLRLAEKLIVN